MLKYISSKNCLIFLLLFFILYGCAYTDERLYGKWKSDLALTTDYNDKSAILTEQQKELFSQLFGKMEIEYMKNGKCKFKLPEDNISVSNKEIKSDSFEEVCEYKILYKNNNTVVLKEETPLMGETLTLLHFVDDETYWVYLGDDEMTDIHIREYFKRVD